MSDNENNLVLTGKAFWAHVTKPNEASGKFQLDLSIDEKTEKLLVEKGITIKDETEVENPKTGTKDDRKHFVTLKKTAIGKDGTLYSPPVIVDSKKNPLTAGTLIGNGSTVNVSANVFDWNFKGKKGKSLGFNAVQVTDLVEYKNSAADRFKEVTGFVQEQTTDTSASDSEDHF